MIYERIQALANEHLSQIVPLEDLIKVADLVEAIAKQHGMTEPVFEIHSCKCRLTAGYPSDQVEYCMAMGLIATGDAFKTRVGARRLTKEEYIAKLEEFDRKGLVHVLDSFGAMGGFLHQVPFAKLK